MSKIAFLYPGQGAQKAGMGKDFYEQSKKAAELFDLASDWLGLDMKQLCFEENDKLNRTEYTQAALVTTCLAMTRELEENGIIPEVCAGLSLGEYAAIAAAGGMSEEDAVKTVRKRGILMEKAVPDGKGAMAAVLGLSAEEVLQSIEPVKGVSIANYNCPGQIVITGMKSSVELAAESLKKAGAKRVLMLNVSGPFHSPFLKEAGEALYKELEAVNFKALRIPYVTNVTAEYITDINKTADLLRRQVASSVLWQQSVEKMIADGVDTFIEIGPGKTLAGFMKKIDKTAVIYNIGSMADLENTADILKGRQQ